MRFDWNSDKNAWLKRNRGISFDEIVVHLGRGDVWKISPHPNRATYPNQSIAFVVIADYVYLVPFDTNGDIFFLRTIIPSRKATRQYLEERRARP